MRDVGRARIIPVDELPDTKRMAGRCTPFKGPAGSGAPGVSG